MKKPTSVATLTDLGRVRLSKSFFMRDFLFSDIAAIHGLPNLPDDPDLAIAARLSVKTSWSLCKNMFGRIAIRSAYRSCKVNGLGSSMMLAGKKGYNCASNESNYAGHIWDRRDRERTYGRNGVYRRAEFLGSLPG